MKLSEQKKLLEIAAKHFSLIRKAPGATYQEYKTVKPKINVGRKTDNPLFALFHEVGHGLGYSPKLKGKYFPKDKKKLVGHSVGIGEGGPLRRLKTETEANSIGRDLIKSISSTPGKDVKAFEKALKPGLNTYKRSLVIGKMEKHLDEVNDAKYQFYDKTFKRIHKMTNDKEQDAAMKAILRKSRKGSPTIKKVHDRISSEQKAYLRRNVFGDI